ncbi:hypothetical protein F5X96DRAFT_615538 [Biscogniauxia mediterranea]|nr:hypothetical protein F5X96DRAFT_615538 [Biscogniauxia mediterranea]
MAILEEIPGIEVTVQVNGRNAIEYDDPHASEQESAADSPTSCRYIESIDDAEFSVSVVATSRYTWRHHHAFRATLYADGQRVGKKVMKESSSDNRITIEGRHHFDMKKQQWYLQHFKFAAISTVDDSNQDRVQRDKELAARLGIIEVRLRRVRVLGRLPVSSHHSRGCQPQAKHELSEKSLKGKAISHGVDFSSNEIDASVRGSSRISYIPGEKEHFGVYRFYYRSKDALRQELIIPRSPSPAHNISGLSRAEIERLARERLRQIKVCQSLPLVGKMQDHFT